MKNLTHTILVNDDFEYVFSNGGLESWCLEDGDPDSPGIKISIESSNINTEMLFPVLSM